MSAVALWYNTPSRVSADCELVQALSQRLLRCLHDAAIDVGNIIKTEISSKYGSLWLRYKMLAVGLAIYNSWC